VRVRGISGIKTMALAFVAGPKMQLTDEIWDYEDWCRRHRRPFLMGLDRRVREADKIAEAPNDLR
jgi:hypothetical protein